MKSGPIEDLPNFCGACLGQDFICFQVGFYIEQYSLFHPPQGTYTDVVGLLKAFYYHFIVHSLYAGNLECAGFS